MPGDNCAVFNCGSCRRTKGIGIFKLPAANNDNKKKLTEELLNEIRKSRVLDKAFKERIKNDRVFICEKHFLPEQIEICKCRLLISLSIANLIVLFLHFGLF